MDSLTVKPANLRYFLQQDVNAMNQLKGVYFYESNNKLVVVGEMQNLKNAKDWIQKSISMYKESNETVTEFAAISYLNKSNSQQALEVQENKTNCAVVLTSVDPGNKSIAVKKQIVFTRPVVALNKVAVYQGDITMDKSDVVVNNTNSSFDFTQGAVSKKLLEKGGQTIMGECHDTSAPHATNLMRVTNAGNLPCKKIIHVVTPSSVQDIGKILLDVLKTVEKLGYTSVGIPAIGTGNLNLPSGAIAKVMRQAIFDYQKSNLSKSLQINVVVFQHSMVGEFQQEICGLLDCILIFPRDCSKEFGTANPGIRAVNVEVKQGDITKDGSDAIVNSTNEAFDLNQGKVSQSILQSGGKDIMSKCQDSTSKFARKHLRVTSGGNLKCKHIIHVVLHNNQLEFIIKEVLRVVDELKLRSVAFPALGTGNLKLVPLTIAKSMKSAFDDFFVQNKTTTVKEITVVVFEKEMVTDFKSGITIPKILGKGKEYCKKLDLHQHNYRRISENFEVFDTLDEEGKKAILDLQGQDVTIKLSPSGKSFLVSGIKSNAKAAVTGLLKILDDQANCVKLAERVQWQFRNPLTQKLENFSLKVNEKLEKQNTRMQDLRMQNAFPKNVVTTVNTSFGDMKVNLLAETATLAHHPFSIGISKKVVEWKDFPSTWTEMGDEPYIKVLVDQGVQEHTDILRKFNESANIVNQCIKLERLQHKARYIQFNQEQKLVMQRMKKAGLTDHAVRRLFHGTGEDVIDIIISNWFDWRLCATANAAHFGKGVYFAVNASYSNQNKYSKPNSKGEKFMFLVDVITGEYTLGNNDMVTAPQNQGGNKNQLYDSVVDDVNSPTIFVTFKDCAAYPHYLLTYK